MLLQNIKNKCTECGLSLADVEKTAGLAKCTIYNWDKVTPSADKLAKVAKVLGTTCEELLGETA